MPVPLPCRRTGSLHRVPCSSSRYRCTARWWLDMPRRCSRCTVLCSNRRPARTRRSRGGRSHSRRHSTGCCNSLPQWCMDRMAAGNHMSCRRGTHSCSTTCPRHNLCRSPCSRTPPARRWRCSSRSCRRSRGPCQGTCHRRPDCRVWSSTSRCWRIPLRSACIPRTPPDNTALRSSFSPRSSRRSTRGNHTFPRCKNRCSTPRRRCTAWPPPGSPCMFRRRGASSTPRHTGRTARLPCTPEGCPRCT